MPGKSGIVHTVSNAISNAVPPTHIFHTIRTEEYAYDKLSRLTGVDYGDGETQSYTFDAMGNRSTKTDGGTTSYTYDNANMLLTAGGNNYTNDANGNTLTGGGRTNTWDCENRLTQCTKGLNTSTFTYGADGLRRSRTVTNSGTSDTTYYALDGQNVVREMKRNSQNQLVNKATYLTGASGPVYRRDDVTGTYKWYVYDGLGSVVSEVDEGGTPSAPIAFDVYGQRRYGDVGTSPNKFCGSLGHASEDETGLVYMRARYMDPNLGRFVSEDPARHASNWYVYCSDNPASRYDATGCEDSLAGQMAAAGIASGLASFGSTFLSTGDLRKALINGAIAAILGVFAPFNICIAILAAAGTTFIQNILAGNDMRTSALRALGSAVITGVFGGIAGAFEKEALVSLQFRTEIFMAALDAELIGDVFLACDK